MRLTPDGWYGGALFLRDDRDQHIRLPARTRVQRDVAAEDRGRAVARVVMSERPDAGPHLAERLDAGARLAGIHIIGAADGQRDPITFWQNDAGRPDLDVNLVDLARRQLLLLIVRMIRAV